ncbi:protein kinase [Streptomyces albidoflavus]|uniref:Serine/threonine protein kinase n=1 Tax=Streptomyces albidoflavus TaxID=1886 RepID=A0AB37X8Y4_9ACTN|nr:MULTISPECIES: serine/threonine-protein kinase [Streptomyces]QLA59071.1 protein kinase [Streptomyces violascens]AWL32105.1 serine/threonine protein kinase [Streptomyces sp. SM17]RZE35774.1 serine/threonine protein kinase [Streptomyces albidoflavus]RZE59897.1 serine/threonine protein kinase [Streptomyces albidoflavus]RZE71956.1 serine/threonine protein kinase [Streptomyces albidoflavus]
MFDLTGSGAEPLRPDDPAHIGGIRLAGRLGTGGMGRVFLGVHEGRYVAVKQVLPSVAGEDQDFVRRFGHELDNLSRLPPEATAPLLASDRDARPPWLATAYVPGLTLSDAVRLHQGPLPAEAVWLLLREAAAGLVPVHGLGMVHRDLKPSNVMLTVEGATVIDFGVARATEQSQLTRSGVVVGTPAYMAPEQAVTRRDLTGAVDVFALGSVIAYAAGGNPPFGEESGPAVLYRIVHEEPDLEAVRELDPALADLVTACLAKDPEARPTAAELVRRATEHGPSTAPLWPDSFSADLAAKAAFAAHVQEPGPPPPVSVETLNLGRKSGPKPPAERRRRTRVLLAVVPVVIAGSATLAVQLLPHISDADDPTGAAPSLSASAPTTPGTGPSGPASPATSAKDKEKEKDEKKDADGDKEDKDADKGAGQGNDSENGADAPGTGDKGNGSGGSSSSGAGGGSAPTEDPDGDAKPPSGAHRYRNGENAKCLAAPFNSPPTTAACNGSGTVWAFRPLSDGSFEIVHESGRSCLSSGAGGTLLLSCNQAESRRWRTGPEGTLKSVGTGGCLGTVNGSRITTTQCTGSPSQRWTAT